MQISNLSRLKKNYKLTDIKNMKPRIEEKTKEAM